MDGYAKMQRGTLSGRALEREVFTRITARMAAADPDQPGGLSAKLEAVCENRRLWTIIAMDLASEENTCPIDVKAALLSLAAFVESRSATILQNGGDLDALVEINRNIIGGLSGASNAAAA